MTKAVHLSAIALLAGVSMLSTGPAESRASGDGFIGPVAFGDQALDQSLAATNRELQQRDYQNDLVAEITTAVVLDYDAILVALRDTAPEPEDTPLPATDFTADVSGDISLQQKVALIHSGLRDDQFYTFLELARVSDPALEDGFDDGPLEATAFGPAIGGDATLNAKVAHIFDLVSVQQATAFLADAPAPVFDDRALDRVIPAVAGNGG